MTPSDCISAHVAGKLAALGQQPLRIVRVASLARKREHIGIVRPMWQLVQPLNDGKISISNGALEALFAVYLESLSVHLLEHVEVAMRGGLRTCLSTCTKATITRRVQVPVPDRVR